MTTTQPKPTSQGISALLTDAGFELGVDAGRHGPGDVDGYAVFANRLDDGIVLVSYWGPADESPAMLRRYAKAIESAGFSVRWMDEGTYLRVTTEPVTAPSGAEEDK